MITSKCQRGFTIIEIVMVLVLVAVLSATAISTFLNFTNEAKVASTNDKLNDIKRAIVGDGRMVSQGRFMNPGFESHMGSVPTSLTQLTTQGAQTAYNPFTKTGWRGPYISSTATDWNKDAWGTTIVYSSAARTLTSYGPDKASGGGDDIVVSF